MSTTNELFNSFCLALREDMKHRNRQVALHTRAINSIVAVSGGQDDETGAVHTASINDTLADIERQADAAGARIPAMTDMELEQERRAYAASMDTTDTEEQS